LGAADAKLVRIGRVETPGAAAVRMRWLGMARAQAADQDEWDAARAAGAPLSDEQAISLAEACAASVSADCTAGALGQPESVGW
jgi:hypothetical protein